MPERLDPIPVKCLRFHRPTDAAGLSVATGVSSNRAGRASRYLIHYLPWMRNFHLEFDRGPDSGTEESYIPEANVMSWDPIDPDEILEFGERRQAPPKQKKPVIEMPSPEGSRAF